MSDRITRENVDNRCDAVNRELEQSGSTRRLMVQDRNGYYGVDEYDGGVMIAGPHYAGTKREVYDWLGAMLRFEQLRQASPLA